MVLQGVKKDSVPELTGSINNWNTLKQKVLQLLRYTGIN